MEDHGKQLVGHGGGTGMHERIERETAARIKKRCRLDEQQCEFPRCRPCSNLDVDRDKLCHPQDCDPDCPEGIHAHEPAVLREEGWDGKGPHPSHDLRSSDSSLYDLRCKNCGRTDVSGNGWEELVEPCPKAPDVTSQLDKAFPSDAPYSTRKATAEEEHLAELFIEEEARRAFMKETNPKDAIGTGKVPFDLVPETGITLMALGHLEGALKYGAYNYRAAGIRISVYYAAARRHMAKFWGGEWEAPDTRVPHLASSMACHNIILDAWYCGKAVDDRPPAVFSMAELIDAQEEIIGHLRELFKDHDPRHWTIHDTNLIKEMLAESDADHKK